MSCKGKFHSQSRESKDTRKQHIEMEKTSLPKKFHSLGPVIYSVIFPTVWLDLIFYRFFDVYASITTVEQLHLLPQNEKHKHAETPSPLFTCNVLYFLLPLNHFRLILHTKQILCSVWKTHSKDILLLRVICRSLTSGTMNADRSSSSDPIVVIYNSHANAKSHSSRHQRAT